MVGAGPELPFRCVFLNEGRIVARATEGDYRGCIIGEVDGAVQPEGGTRKAIRTMPFRFINRPR